MRPESDIQSIAGIGPAKAAAFARMGISTVRDLLFHLPRGYEDRGNIRTLIEGCDGLPSSFLLTVGSEPKTARIRKGMSITRFRVFDDTGTVEVLFFNQDFLKNVFHVGDVYRFTGKLVRNKSVYQLSSPKYEAVKEGVVLPDLYPVYTLTDGVTSGVLRKATDTAVREALPYLTDYLPESIRRKYKFPTLQTAIKHLHAPLDMGKVKAALRRLAFDDFFLFALGMAFSKKRATHAAAPVIRTTAESKKRFLSLLPYELTGAQARACDEILCDMEKGVAMNRILVGDVGCGKTVCAAFAAFAALAAGHQAAIMAPTEILARQHYEELSALFGRLGYRVALLLGATSQKEKREIYAHLSSSGNDRIDLVIGTHALLSDKTVFSDLALAVTDEQHRFGVHQRAVLREKCPSVHLLVMSATPIPRTLALVLYGDLDISRIDEMPKGRKRVATYVVNESYRARLYAFIRKQVAEGGQVYVVCPAIEEKEEDAEAISFDLLGRRSVPPLKTAKEVCETMRAALPELSVDFLHGKMRSVDKDAAMRRFADGETHVLVSTTVIEVGVNVPRASLMIVENAERFGLSQLHQLRGRVGRGTKESFCVLLSDSEGAEAKARLETMRTTYDGYLVAEQDLKQRGPGDFLVSSGTDTVRQSGGLSFRFASLCEDTDLLSAAAEEAKAIVSLTGSEADAFWQENTPLQDETRRAFDMNSPLLS